MNVSKSALHSPLNQVDVQVGSAFTTPTVWTPIPKDTTYRSVQVDHTDKAIPVSKPII